MHTSVQHSHVCSVKLTVAEKHAGVIVVKDRWGVWIDYGTSLSAVHRNFMVRFSFNKDTNITINITLDAKCICLHHVIIYTCLCGHLTLCAGMRLMRMVSSSSCVTPSPSMMIELIRSIMCIWTFWLWLLLWTNRGHRDWDADIHPLRVTWWHVEEQIWKQWWLFKHADISWWLKKWLNKYYSYTKYNSFI